jgi:sporulation protein YlmC with PRC-barrel domain
MDIPIGVAVQCVDSLAGQSTCIIVNPAMMHVTHVVVKADDNGIEHLVPLTLIIESSRQEIKLRCTKGEFDQLTPLVQTEYIQPSRPYENYDSSQYLLWPYATPNLTTIPLEHTMIPPEDLAVKRGARVDASDGTVGRVNEFLVNPVNGHISHLILEEGSFWNKKHVTIPVADIERIEEDVVYIKLDRQSIEALPAIPVQRDES